MNSLTAAPTCPASFAPAPPHAPLVRFRAHSPAAQLNVLIRAHPRGPLFTLAQMNAVAEDEWQLSLPLPPGTYRYCYYADLVGPAAYVFPAEAEEPSPPMRRRDAVLTVRATA